MNELAKRDFEQLSITHKGTIPPTIADGKLMFDGLGDYTNATDWYRAAFVAAYVEQRQGERTDIEQNCSKLNEVDGGRRISITAFANKKIRGLSSRHAVQFYLGAWGNRPKPIPGQEVCLPSDPFPEWGTIIGMGGLKSSESVEWYTPKIYIEAARDVMGSIDLDPASSEMANEIVKATRYITQDDIPDGLSQNWEGNVWLNPPYGKGSGSFTTKLIEEYSSGRVKSAILLLNAYGFDTIWFQPL
jgi:hypothetical protein